MSFNNDTNQGNSMGGSAGFCHRGERPGIIQSYLQQNAHPNAKAWRELDKLNDRVSTILDRVALTIGGVQVSRKKNEALTPIDDLFDTEYYEQFRVGTYDLVVSVCFTKTGVLRLALVDVTPTPEPKEPDQKASPLQQGPRSAGQTGPSYFSPDWVLGIRDDRSYYNGGTPGFMSCDGYRHTTEVLSRTMEMFAGMNNLAFYIQGMRAKDRLVYVFLDSEIIE